MAESHLDRRRIEAEFAKGIFDTLATEIGRERAVEILTKAVIQMAEGAGKAFASGAEDRRADLLAFAEILPVWQKNEALSIDMKRRETESLDFNVTRCRYAEMYRELGIEELGSVLSCNRDAAFCNGFNPEIQLTRTQTIMGGADHCDFRFSLPKKMKTTEDLLANK
jgi:hypothetical protein